MHRSSTKNTIILGLRKWLLTALSLVIFILFSELALAQSVIVKIAGIRDPMLKNIKLRIDEEQNTLPKPLTPTAINDFYDEALTSINNSLQAYGYFKANIQSQLTHVNDTWTASYFITLGPPLRITQLSVSVVGPGKNDPAFQKLLQRFPLKVGDILVSKNYENAKQVFFDVAQNTGYLSAQFSQREIRVDIDAYTANVKLVFDTGPRFYFGKVSFYQTTQAYTLELLNRFIPFQLGQPYSTEKLFEFQSGLSSTPYFQTVNVKAEQEQAEDYFIPIKVTLTPRKENQYSAGIGYGTDTGARMTLGWEWRRASASGNYMQTLLQLSEMHQNDNFQMRYIIPGRNPATDHYTISAGLFNNKPNHAEYFTQQVGIGYTNITYGWEQALAVDLQHERFHVFLDPSEDVTNLIPRAAWEKAKTDNPVTTNKGYRISLDIEAALKILLSDINFIQPQFQGKYINSFNDNKTRILLSTDLGYTAVSDMALFPASQRFYAGGTQSVRGYGFQSLGPGLNLVEGSAEIQQKIYGNFYGAAFFDTGNAFNEMPLDLHSGAGLGVVYRSPIGPIELTVAKALNTPGWNLNGGLKIQLVMGPDI